MKAKVITKKLLCYVSSLVIAFTVGFYYNQFNTNVANIKSSITKADLDTSTQLKAKLVLHFSDINNTGFTKSDEGIKHVSIALRDLSSLSDEEKSLNSARIQTNAGGSDSSSKSLNTKVMATDFIVVSVFENEVTFAGDETLVDRVGCLMSEKNNGIYVIQSM